MHSNWNPWHGCIKCSEGCQNCYVYYLDGMQGKSGSDIYRTKSGFRYPLHLGIICGRILMRCEN
ncbi:MAG: DUF5131 family protein, partial [Clostridia bacterium]|nr:DUF5131 family protein [Clostridia bacterium]